MKIMLKILCAPFILLLYLLILFLSFILSISAAILNVAASLLAILAIATLILESVPNGIALLIIAWLISPVGLPLFAARLLRWIENLRASFWSWLND
ncbi:MAG: succinate dehydrogenase [Clostridia bacterium]|nr:succinate dehydrogenase [Clostridia bacterium]